MTCYLCGNGQYKTFSVYILLVLLGSHCYRFYKGLRVLHRLLADGTNNCWFLEGIIWVLLWESSWDELQNETKSNSIKCSFTFSLLLKCSRWWVGVESSLSHCETTGLENPNPIIWHTFAQCLFLCTPFKLLFAFDKVWNQVNVNVGRSIRMFVRGYNCSFRATAERYYSLAQTLVRWKLWWRFSCWSEGHIISCCPRKLA